MVSRLFHKGFSLPEVLVTLVIIGVIASFTIPNLLNKTQNKEAVVQVQKMYSTLTAATNSIIAEQGPVSTWNWNTGDLTMTDIVDNYKSQLRIAKSCDFNINTCYYENHWKALDDNSYAYYFHGGNAYYNILQDGTFVKFFKCQSAYSGNNTLSPVCNVSAGDRAEMQIIININGNKPPNKVGRDVFFFLITDKKGVIVPTLNTSTCSTSGSGFGCSAKIIQEGAMNY